MHLFICVAANAWRAQRRWLEMVRRAWPEHSPCYALDAITSQPWADRDLYGQLLPRP
jgi:hypothetical protein